MFGHWVFDQRKGSRPLQAVPIGSEEPDHNTNRIIRRHTDQEGYYYWCYNTNHIIVQIVNIVNRVLSTGLLLPSLALPSYYYHSIINLPLQDHRYVTAITRIPHTVPFFISVHRCQINRNNQPLTMGSRVSQKTSANRQKTPQMPPPPFPTRPTLRFHTGKSRTA